MNRFKSLFLTALAAATLVGCSTTPGAGGYYEPTPAPYAEQAPVTSTSDLDTDGDGVLSQEEQAQSEAAGTLPDAAKEQIDRLAELGIDCADFYNAANFPKADLNGNGALDMDDEVKACVL